MGVLTSPDELWGPAKQTDSNMIYLMSQSEDQRC